MILLILQKKCGLKIIGKTKFAGVEAYFNQSYITISLEKETGKNTALQIYPFRQGAFVAAGVDYDIIMIDDIEVKKEIGDFYYWDKGEHCYYMITEHIERDELEKIVDSISVQITDKGIVNKILGER